MVAPLSRNLKTLPALSRKNSQKVCAVSSQQRGYTAVVYAFSVDYIRDITVPGSE